VSSRSASWGLVSLALVALAAPANAQGRPNLTLEREDGSSRTVAIRFDRGYATVPVSVLTELGWSATEDADALRLDAAGEISVTMRVDSPFFRWDGVVLQFADEPYRAGGTTYVPVQFLADFLPRRLPGLYEFSGEDFRLRAGDLSLLGTPDGRRVAMAGAIGASSTSAETAAVPPGSGVKPAMVDETRVVIIDPGHGGADPGALGLAGVREKNVALGIALRLAALLDGRPDLEVHMIRDDDTFVDIWERGRIATEIRGERAGIFVSIHANSFPTRRDARGFETYFLSDARTEHERRVAAIENAPLSMSADAVDGDALEDLDFILRDLKNFDHAHWSEELASLIQEQLAEVHPGPNRGVKQGVLAVLTNALMPSVLVEVGYLSNESEARTLASEDFHQASAEAISEAVLTFFERYPPGSGGGGAQEDR